MREVIATGKTVDEATEAALAQLGLSMDEVTVEVLELPQKKFFKTIPAKVKVTVDADKDAEQAAPAAPAVKPAAPAAAKPAAPAAKPAPAAQPAAPAAAKPAAPAAAPVSAEDAAPAQTPAAPAHEELPEVPVSIEDNEKLSAAVAYLKDICARLGAPDVEITAVQQGESIILKVDGEGAGALIGHRGEVMEALSYLASLVANRAGGDYMKLSLDVNHYRSKREANLVALAKRIGAKVAKSGRSHTLEPMNPYERRIIHSAISEMEGVKSESTGEGANRRVMIMSTAPGAKMGGERPFRQADRRGRKPMGGKVQLGRGPRPHGEHGDRPPFEKRSSVPEREFADKPRDPTAAPVVPRRTETVNDGADLPLYGKIEL